MVQRSTDRASVFMVEMRKILEMIITFSKETDKSLILAERRYVRGVSC